MAAESEQPPDSGQLSAIASLSGELVRARDKQAVARILIDTCLSLLPVDVAAVALVAGGVGSLPIGPWLLRARARLAGTRLVVADFAATGVLVVLFLACALQVAARSYNPFIDFRF